MNRNYRLTPDFLESMTPELMKCGDPVHIASGDGFMEPLQGVSALAKDNEPLTPAERNWFGHTPQFTDCMIKDNVIGGGFNAKRQTAREVAALFSGMVPRGHYKEYPFTVYPWKCADNVVNSPIMGNHLDNIICDDLVSGKVYMTTGKPGDLNEKSLRTVIKQFNNIIEKKENKMAENRAGFPQAWDDEPIQGTVRTRPLEVIITPVENGFIIKVGCARFVSETWDKVQKALGEYFKDPKTAARKYYYKTEKK